MVIEKDLRPTLLAVELDEGEEVHLRLADGTVRKILLEKTQAKIYETTLKKPKTPQMGARTVLQMTCQLRVDGRHCELVRWVGNQRSFYEPIERFGLWIWFDATSRLFDHLNETHGDCRPRKHARFAFQEAGCRICPVLLHPWCPLPPGGLRIEDCYEGSDCWMGPYEGTDAHGGLDINHPAGTPIWTPVSIDDHELFHSIDQGANNNRWRGLHRWEDGSTWVLQVHHVIRLRVNAGQPLPAGIHLADGAGVLTGWFEHSHFVFKIREPGDDNDILLDPWILFWQMYRDRAATGAA